MKSFDKLLGKIHTFHAGSVEIEMEIGSYCTFEHLAPSNGLHYHNSYEIAYITHGKGYFVNNEEAIELNSGTVFIAEPGTVHEIKLCDEGATATLELVYFLFNIHSEMYGNKDDYNERVIINFMKEHTQSAQTLGNIGCYLMMIDQYHITSKNDEKMLVQIYSQMMIDMIRTLISQPMIHNEIPNASKSLIDIAMVYIRENIERRITVAEVATITGTSTRNLQYLFRQYLDMTVIGYINERKVNLACSFLKMNITVAEVGRMIGIEDASQFSRLFKKNMELSPKQYQKKYTTSGVRFAAMTTHK